MARPALAASRAIDILNFLASRPDETFSLSELARRTGVNVASTHAIVAALTQAGYLNRSFVVRVHEQHPWEDEFRPGGMPRSETDVIVLHRLRSWLESAGALRKRGKVLRRTERGAAMSRDPLVAWEAFTRSIAPEGWDRFVIEDAAVGLLGVGLAAAGIWSILWFCCRGAPVAP